MSAAGAVVLLLTAAGTTCLPPPTPSLETCQKFPCVRKCCPAGHALNRRDCVKEAKHPLLAPFRPGGYKEGHFNFIYGLPTCDLFRRKPLEDPEDRFEVSLDGSLFFPRDRLVVNVSSYCIDVVLNPDHITAIQCLEAAGTPRPSTKSPSPSLSTWELIQAVILLLSVPFMVATVLLYCIVPRRRKLHAWSVMSHVSSLAVGMSVLGINQLFTKYLTDRVCVSAAFIIYFSFLASFFWLNVMCLDIFWTFSGFRSLRGTVKEREFKKFIIYSIYSWGCPLIMLTVCLVMHFHEGISDDYVKPGFGITACWFKDTTSALAYFYGPVAVLILCNIILFILTAVKIAKLKREAEMFNNSESRRHDDEDNKQRFNLYLKLFLVMGVNWATEIISWAAGGPEYLWYLTDIANTLQGVLIFIIFVWKDRIRKLLMERFCPKRAAAATASKSTAITYSTRGSSSISSVKPGGKINQESLRMTNMVTSEESDVP